MRCAKTIGGSIQDYHKRNVFLWLMRFAFSVVFICILSLSVSASEVNKRKPYWIFFHDKEFNTYSDNENQIKAFSPRSIKRRQNTLSGITLQYEDLAVSENYISRVENYCDRRIRTRSRWLNAVSIELNKNEVGKVLADLEFVTRISPVAEYRRPSLSKPLAFDSNDFIPHRDNYYDYGNSLLQNSFLNIPAIHNLGWRGKGVLIGICDTGYNNLFHNCFEHIDILETWDFLNNDADVSDGDDMGVGDHGTRTLSILAGLDPGRFVGVAPEATYVLAKTENTEWERPVEEDYWVAAIEWMDVLGVDVVSSSLGYSDWYQYADMDGETAITTRAANRAAEVGMVIVNSIGNYGNRNYPADKMGAPADSRFVLAIGGLNRDSTFARFSSHGPTYDGRIKPDFVSMAVGVVFASSSNREGYLSGLGTSYSCPAVAGLCALLIQSNPYLTPTTLLDALQRSANNSDSPDTLIGWGIPDGLSALGSVALKRSELVIQLTQGWNTISMNIVHKPVRTIEHYFSVPVMHGNIVIVKDAAGRFYAPQAGFNNIPFWNYLEGYQVLALQSDSLVVTGPIANYTEPIQLSAGWHLIAYLPDFPIAVEDACRSLVEDNALNLIKDERGRFYLPRFDFSNLPSLVPSRGYHVSLSHNSTLFYPRQRAAEFSEQHYESLNHFVQPEHKEKGMSLLLIANDESIKEGDEVACLNDEGLIIGAGRFSNGKCGVAVWDSGKLKDFNLRLWHSRKNTECVPYVNMFEGQLEYEDNGVAIAYLSCSEGSFVEEPSLEIDIYPNPFNDVIRVKYASKNPGIIKGYLYSITGSLVAEFEQSSQNSSGGELNLSTGAIPSGQYIVYINDRNESLMSKCVHIK